MSYDVALFRIGDGEDPGEAFWRMAEGADADDPNPGPIRAECERAKEGWMRALQARVAGLQRFTIDFAAVARADGTTEEEARRRWRHIELNDETMGLQISLHDEAADVTLPYWHEGEAAARAFERMFQCVESLAATADFIAFDPQLNRRIDPSSAADRAAARERYLEAKHAVERAIAMRGERKPWWKLW